MMRDMFRRYAIYFAIYAAGIVTVVAAIGAVIWGGYQRAQRHTAITSPEMRSLSAALQNGRCRVELGQKTRVSFACRDGLLAQLLVHDLACGLTVDAAKYQVGGELTVVDKSGVETKYPLCMDGTEVLLGVGDIYVCTSLPVGIPLGAGDETVGALPVDRQEQVRNEFVDSAIKLYFIGEETCAIQALREALKAPQDAEWPADSLSRVRGRKFLESLSCDGMACQLQAQKLAEYRKGLSPQEFLDHVEHTLYRWW